MRMVRSGHEPSTGGIELLQAIAPVPGFAARVSDGDDLASACNEGRDHHKSKSPNSELPHVMFFIEAGDRSAASGKSCSLTDLVGDSFDEESAETRTLPLVPRDCLLELGSSLRMKR